MSEQLGLRGPKTAKPLGMPLQQSDLDKFREEQVYQLYELMEATMNKINEEEADKETKGNENDQKT